jgi:ABC-type spermidine/putrescine transport system permease subunit II
MTKSGPQSRRRILHIAADSTLALVGIVTLAFILMPVAVVFAVSLTAGESFAIPTGALSLRWYGELFGDAHWRHAFFNSVSIGVLSTLGALVLGLPAAYAATRYDYRGKFVVEGLALSPLLLPTVAIAAGQYLLLAKLSISGTMLAIVLTHIVYVMPFVFIICGLGIAAIDPQLEAAAFSLGASRWTIFRRILIPNMLPSVVAAALLCFVSSFDELVLALFVGGGVKTVPLTILGELKYQLKPTIAALSVSLSLFTVTAASLAILLMRRGKVKLGAVVS